MFVIFDILAPCMREKLKFVEVARSVQVPTALLIRNKLTRIFAVKASQTVCNLLRSSPTYPINLAIRVDPGFLNGRVPWNEVGPLCRCKVGKGYRRASIDKRSFQVPISVQPFIVHRHFSRTTTTLPIHPSTVSSVELLSCC